MSKKVLSVALLAVLATMADGCQKENITELRPETSISEVSTVYTVQYAVDGVLHTKTLHNEEEYNALLMQLMALSRSGAEVEISDDNYSPNAFSTKESVSYTTPSESEAIKWTKQKMSEGYKVMVTYDTNNNLYVCTAYK